MKQYLEKFKEQWQGFDKRIKASIIIVSSFILFMTAARVSESSNERRILNNHNKSTEVKRIIGDNDSIYKDKDRLYRENQRKLDDQQRVLLQELAELKEKLKKIEENKIISKNPGSKEEPSKEVKQEKVLDSNKGKDVRFYASDFKEPKSVDFRNENKIIRNQRSRKKTIKDMNNGSVSFPVKRVRKKEKIVGAKVVSGSYVKGTIIGGADAPEGKVIPILIQLDEVYILPNNKYIDLSGCFIVAKAQSDMSSERVELQPDKIGCLNKKNDIFEEKIVGWAIDSEDERFGVKGQVISKRDRVAAASFGASFVSGISQAVQNQQATVTQNPLGSTSTIVSGNAIKHAANGGLTSASNEVANWYLEQAKNLAPNIRIGSGRKVWLVMNKSFVIPQDFLFSMNGMLDEVKYSKSRKKEKSIRYNLGG